ncbi:MAG: TIGR04255 family protein [Bdellovibrionota bacterium]
MNYKKYQNPPITEAMFEIQAELPNTVTLLQIEELAKKHEGKFPKRKPRRQFQGNFEFGEGTSNEVQTIDLGIDGYLCWSHDDLEVAQFRLDGFAYSRLKPYQGWDKAFPEAKSLWLEYKNTLNPIKAKRLAIRFINRIEIPETKFNLSKYFLSPIEPPNIEGAEIENFIKQIVFKVPSYGCRAVIIQTLVPNRKPMSTTVIFDLEVSTEINTNIAEDDFDRIFLKLRAAKNDLFEESITDDTRSLFK